MSAPGGDKCICNPKGWLEARDEDCPQHGRAALPGFWDEAERDWPAEIREWAEFELPATETFLLEAADAVERLLVRVQELTDGSSLARSFNRACAEIASLKREAAARELRVRELTDERDHERALKEQAIAAANAMSEQIARDAKLDQHAARSPETGALAAAGRTARKADNGAGFHPATRPTSTTDDSLSRLRPENESLVRRVQEAERALREIAENAESWHGPPPDMGHVRALAVIATWARAVLGGDGQQEAGPT